MRRPQRAAFGELHAIGDRHGLVVPRRFAVVAIAGSRQGALARPTAASARPTTDRQRSRSARSAALPKTARWPGMISSFGGGASSGSCRTPPHRRACAALRRHGGAQRRKERFIRPATPDATRYAFSNFSTVCRRVLGLEVVIDLLPDIRVRDRSRRRRTDDSPRRCPPIADRYLRPDQPDIADVMLGAGMVAAR